MSRFFVASLSVISAEPPPNTDCLHALLPADRLVVAPLRSATHAQSGLLSGVALRAPFAARLTQPPAAGVPYEIATVGGIPCYWCRPANAVLYLHRELT